MFQGCSTVYEHTVDFFLSYMSDPGNFYTEEVISALATNPNSPTALKQVLTMDKVMERLRERISPEVRCLFKKMFFPGFCFEINGLNFFVPDLASFVCRSETGKYLGRARAGPVPCRSSALKVPALV